MENPAEALHLARRQFELHGIQTVAAEATRRLKAPCEPGRLAFDFGIRVQPKGFCMPLISAKKFVASISSGHMMVSTMPDVCKTPTPGGPIPIPYPNIATPATPGPGYTTKTLVMGTPMYTKKSKTAISNGDQPGVAMGIISNKIMGMCEVVMSSTDVKAGGGGVVRTLDKTLSNG